MFYEWENCGFGDAQADCLSKVRSYSPSYVFAGSQIRFTGFVSWGLSRAFGSHESNIRSAVASRGYTQVQVSVGGGLALSFPLTISFTVPGDQGSINDVESNVRGALEGAGYRVASAAIAFAYRPSAEQVCRGVGSGQVGSPTQPTTPGLPSPTGGGGFLGLSSSTLMIAAAVGIGALVLLRR